MSQSAVALMRLRRLRPRRPIIEALAFCRPCASARAIVGQVRSARERSFSALGCLAEGVLPTHRMRVFVDHAGTTQIQLSPRGYRFISYFESGRCMVTSDWAPETPGARLLETRLSRGNFDADYEAHEFAVRQQSLTDTPVVVSDLATAVALARIYYRLVVPMWIVRRAFGASLLRATAGAAVVAALVSLGLYARAHYFRDQAPAISQGPTAAASRFEVLPAVPPNTLPVVGAAGHEHVDMAALRSLFSYSRYTVLTQAFEQAQAEFEADPRKEDRPIAAAAAFVTHDPSLEAKFDGWIEDSPESFAPYLASGTYLEAVAEAQGGTRAVAERADGDLRRALSIKPKLVAAMDRRMRVLALLGRKDDVSRVAGQADAACPVCFLFRTTVVELLSPRWGGTYEEMHAYARRFPQASDARFALLDGYVDLDVARTARERNDLPGAAAAIERSIALGQHAPFLLERARVRVLQKDTDGALADLTAAADLSPGAPDVLALRAAVHAARSEWEAAGIDLRDAARVDASDDAKALIRPVVKALGDAAWKLHRQGRDVDALRLYNLAGALDAHDPTIERGRFDVLASQENPSLPLLEQAAEGAPDDLKIHQQLGSALLKHGQTTRAAEVWTEYLARHPEDGHARLARAEAYHRLGNEAGARADARQACDVGVTEGCSYR